MRVSYVVATDKNGGIGNKGKLPWKPIKQDIEFFRSLTTNTISEKQNVVIMGSKTYNSIPARHRPLKGRINIVLTRRPESITNTNVITMSNVEDTIHLLYTMRGMYERIFVIGGSTIYERFLPWCNKIFVTQIENEYECDCFFHIPSSFELHSSDIQNQDGLIFSFDIYVR